MRTRPDKEAQHVIGTSRTSQRPCARPSTARRRTSTCTVAVWGLVSLLVPGCAGSGNRALQPRTRDLGTLQQEAATAPDAPEPPYQIALVYASQQRYDDALRALHTALQRDGDYEPALTFMAKLFFDGGRSVEGAQYFSSRPLEAWSEPVRINVALLLGDAGRYDEARVLLEGARHGTHADAARANLAYLDWIEGRQARAGKEFEALEGALESPPARNNVALARLQRGDVAASARMLEDLATTHPEFTMAASNLALVLRHWLFEDDRAAVYEAVALGDAPPQLSEAVLHELLTGSAHEDAAPQIVPAPGEASEVPREPLESNDDASPN